MATATTSVNHDVFHKFKNVKITARQDGDGHEREVEVREDEEQSVKLQEIIDLLVAAGYFRARIKGLSPFDKVVGGMTWCIESCNVDVDVDLLFQENSTIGQKIALTEKIVAVLPKLKCPHQIEPHQIQGLDFIHIFPVIQWLVKRSMEFRQEMSSFVRSYAINQFNKEFPAEKSNKTATHKKILENVATVNEVYRPHRYYRRKNAPPPDLVSRVQITLLEYGLQGELRKKAVASDANGFNVSEGGLDEQFTEQLLKNMTVTNEDHKEYLILNKEDEELLQKHYESLSTELEVGGAKLEEKQVLTLAQQKTQLEETRSNLLVEKEKLQTDYENCSKSLEEIKEKMNEASEMLEKLEKTEAKSPKSVQEVEELVIINDNIRAQESKFRESCKQELAQLQKSIEQAKQTNGPTTDLDKISSDINDKLEKMKIIRLQLAKKNRTIAALQRQLDEVPNRAELAQYQRRFLELYNQVAAKHKETKQYYTLYNTLEDTKAYMKKELSLLNSISESYPEAIQTQGGKEEFLKQLESILEMVRQSKKKVEARLLNEKRKRDDLSLTLQGFIEQQRKYVGAVRQLSIECKKCELLLAQQPK